MRLPGICYVSHEWLKMAGANETQLPNGRYVPARAEPLYSVTQRWRATWLVFTGRADALVWPETLVGRPNL